ncbi:relaxase/mobilization nuclease domain-containing protein [Burkholderia cepacia]|uniref:Relaxase/mobilization nuclease domain-containing protein n=2 Tax=Burkholderia cepacia TaxID=292 RepID=A0A8I1ARG3_BURCE|nr:relaxase/mobilization nuclease domain-containing protein [Burkholderia cepacia]MBA9897902.1 hypothetical protein [Burkholderia cepacia]MBA9949507.1 hypothetical protein [Burkholderia cepacia]MBA9976443.1 hypothetical protein [Burkholderia cepacia]MBA9997187.1 hypothetical protein [Burkholderia cepacia]MBB0002227.1 hypothetical protein [Burkholderia cepacia]
MIIKIFDSGTGPGRGPINYLLSDKDHKGTTRSVKPEVLLGDPNLTRDIIDNIQNKQKYTCGVIALKKEEVLTPKDWLYIIDKFHEYMMPLGTERINSVWITHHDKGRTELNFVVPKIDLKTGLALNISPPGKQNQEYYRLFAAMMNDHFGFDQIVPKDSGTGLNMKISEYKSGTDTSNFKKDLHRKIQNEIRGGKIKNRDNLINWLNEKSYRVVKTDRDYLTIKYNNKNLRLYGNLYSANPDFKKAADMEFTKQQHDKLEWYKSQRETFFNKRYNKESNEKRSNYRHAEKHTRKRPSESTSNNRFTRTSERIATRMAANSKPDATHQSRSRFTIPKNQDSQQSGSQLSGKWTKEVAQEINNLVASTSANSIELSANSNKNSANQPSTSAAPSGSSDNSSMKVALGSRLTELLAKLVNELDPAKQAELRGQINEVRRQIADLELQEARAKATVEDHILQVKIDQNNFNL